MLIFQFLSHGEISHNHPPHCPYKWIFFCNLIAVSSDMGDNYLHPTNNRDLLIYRWPILFNLLSFTMKIRRWINIVVELCLRGRTLWVNYGRIGQIWSIQFESAEDKQTSPEYDRRIISVWFFLPGLGEASPDYLPWRGSRLQRPSSIPAFAKGFPIHLFHPTTTYSWTPRCQPTAPMLTLWPAWPTPPLSSPVTSRFTPALTSLVRYLQQAQTSRCSFWMTTVT